MQSVCGDSHIPVTLIIGSIFVVVALGLALADDPWWWFVLHAGVLAAAARLNRGHGGVADLVAERRIGGLTRMYLTCLATGVVVEAVRILPGLWEYRGFFGTPGGVGLFVFAGYFILLAAMAETYRALSRRLRPAASFALTVIGFASVGEAFNLVSPLWLVEPEALVLLLPLFVVGYALEAGMAVLASRLAEASLASGEREPASDRS